LIAKPLPELPTGNLPGFGRFLSHDGENRHRDLVSILDQMSTDSMFPILYPPTLEHEDRAQSDFDERNDPPNMKELVQRLEDLRLKDKEDRPLCWEVIAAALRANRFKLDRTFNAIIKAIDGDTDPPLASVPEQEELVALFMPNLTMGNSCEHPLNQEDLVARLQALELKDEDGVLLCREVLVAALESALYEVNKAANWLLNATGQPCRGDLGTPTDDEKAIDKLVQRFRFLDWSTVAMAYNNANHDLIETKLALCPLKSPATPYWM
jgi:hypothetical protein